MSNPTELKELLRFLAQDARVPLAQAMGKVKDLQNANLTTPETISKAKESDIHGIFGDEKVTKQVINAAKRISKKRASSGTETASPTKRRKPSFAGQVVRSPAQVEASLALPTTDLRAGELSKVLLHTNRAPLVLAFAVTLLRYTHPVQPLSSRLSLAQAVVSANSKTKARSVGIQSEPTAEEEGWAQGQPKIKVLGREIAVLKRWGYDPNEGSEDGDSQRTVTEENDDEPPMWGLDLDAMRHKEMADPRKARDAGLSGLPTYDPIKAREYLLRSFASSESDKNGKERKKNARAVVEEKEANAAKLLKAIDLLCQSWARTLGKEELDRRGWAWYVACRPDVVDGAAGWGGKGEVRLSEILDMKRDG